MLRDMIERVQKNDANVLLELINRFDPLLRKYAAKLKYEDAYADIVLYYIELIKAFNLKKMRSQEDAAIVSYINISIKNYYYKMLRKPEPWDREILLSDLSEEQIYYVEAQSAQKDTTDIFMELGIKELLNKKEYEIIYLIYAENYTTAEIARAIKRSRQAVNQLKKRALKKLRESS